MYVLLLVYQYLKKVKDCQRKLCVRFVITFRLKKLKIEFCARNIFKKKKLISRTCNYNRQTFQIITGLRSAIYK